MFKIQQNPEFSHKVKVRVPVDGGFADQEFTARFRVLPWEEVAALDHDNAAQARLILSGWEGIVDEAGHEVPFSDEARDQMIGLIYVRLAILRTYTDAMVKARAGN